MAEEVRELFFKVGNRVRKKECHKVQLGMLRLHKIRKKCIFKCSAMV